MEGAESGKVEQVRPYFISTGDFRRPPIAVSQYHFGDRVDRTNFASFLTWSFRVSRGQIPAQAMCLQYVQNQTGFDYRKSIQSWWKAGRFDSFSPKEQENVRKEFNQVSSHAENEIIEDFPTVFEDDLWIQFLDKKNYIQELLPPNSSKLPQSEFMKVVQAFIVEKRKQFTQAMNED